jgi:hypothetical protein
MDLFEGYNYRINIVGADSSIIVDSNTGLIRGCIADSDENIIVDTVTKTFRGTLIGNITDSNYNVVFDVDQNEINISNLNSKNIKGDIVNNRGEVVYSSFHNTISSVDHIQTISLDAETFFSNTIKGNLLNNRDEVVYDGFHNTLSNIDFITSFNINSDFIESKLFSGNLQGNILDKNGKVIFDVETNKLDLSDMLEEMIYTKNHLSFTCSKKFSFLQKTMSLIDESNPEDYQNFDFAHISIINENTFEDKDLAGMVGFYGSEPEQNNKLFFGSIGFIVNCSDEDKNKILSKNTDNEEDNVPLNLMPTDFVVINSRNNYDLLESEYVYNLIDNLLVFDANGVLSAPIIKTGVHKDLSKITKPTKGMIIFNDNINKFQGYTGTEWVDLH